MQRTDTGFPPDRLTSLLGEVEPDPRAIAARTRLPPGELDEVRQGAP